MTDQSNPETINEGFLRLSQLALARANLFASLATAFFDPDAKLVSHLINGSFVSEIIGYFQELVNRQISASEAYEALTPLKTVQASLSQTESQVLLRELKIEYARLFIGPGHAAVPPYETFYGHKSKDSNPLLMVSPQAVAVEAAYRDAGVAISSDLREPPDHFATECEFLYYLCKKESDSWAEDDNAEALKWRRQQLAFIDGHLGRWGVQFCQDVEAESHNPFYKAIAHFARAIIQIESSDSIDSPNKPDIGKGQPQRI